MGNIFDSMQKTAFKTVQKTMGYPATWTPSAGGEEQTAIVLFKDATARAKLLEVEYDPRLILIEWQLGDFDNLVKAVRKQGSEEIIKVNDQQFGVLQIISKYDGKTYVAEVEQL